MKPLIPSLVFLSTVIGVSVSSGAETKAPVPAVDHADAKPSPAGQFAGKWKSSTDASGELRLKLKPDTATTWSAEATFTFEGTEVPTKVKSVEITGAKVLVVFDWVIDGSPGQSKLTGELAGDTLRGTYQTTGAAGASGGTWTVNRI